MDAAIAVKRRLRAGSCRRDQFETCGAGSGQLPSDGLGLLYVGVVSAALSSELRHESDEAINEAKRKREKRNER